MKYLFRFISGVAIAGTGLMFLVGSAIMQEKTDRAISGINVENCVRVTLISDSEKYELKNNDPISLIVRIENLSDERLTLRHKPVFNFRRVGVNKDRIKLGDSYTGRIDSKSSPNSSSSESLLIEKREYKDFVVNINELKLHDNMVSIDVWQNIFKELGKGEYFLEAEVVVDSSNEESKPFKEFKSNKILVAIP